VDVKLAVAADYAVGDAATGKLSIHGIFSEINPPVLPFVQPQISVVAVFGLTENELTQTFLLSLELRDPLGQTTVIASGLPFQIPASAVSHPERGGQVNQVANIAGIAFQHAGRYTFSYKVVDGPEALIPIYVNQPPPTTIPMLGAGVTTPNA
jgi:hypothetical protein